MISLSTGPLRNSIWAVARSASACLQIGSALFSVGAVLHALLVSLMAQVVELRIGVASGVHLSGGIERGDGVTLFHARAVGDNVGQRHLTVVAGNLRHHDLSGMDCLNYASNTNFALDLWGLRQTRA
ncbi:MAG: hypothetical protein WDO73_16165 [Ignavibacteriota bacterium]